MKVTSVVRPSEILKNDKYQGWPVTIKSANVTAGSDGRKVLKAGTPVTAAGVVANNANAKGLLLYEVDVTDGDATSVRIYSGTVYGAKIAANGITLSAEALAALPRITVEAE